MCAEIINDHYQGADVERNDIYVPWLKRLPRNVGINFYLQIGTSWHAPRLSSIRDQREWSMIGRYSGCRANYTSRYLRDH